MRKQFPWDLREQQCSRHFWDKTGEVQAAAELRQFPLGTSVAAASLHGVCAPSAAHEWGPSGTTHSALGFFPHPSPDTPERLLKAVAWEKFVQLFLNITVGEQRRRFCSEGGFVTVQSEVFEDGEEKSLQSPWCRLN